MQLSINVRTEFFEAIATSPTAVQPGEQISVILQLTPFSDITIGQMLWETPEIIQLAPASDQSQFPVTLSAGETWSYETLFTSYEDREGFGEIKAQLVFHPGDEPATSQAEWAHWVSVFSLSHADESRPLDDELRNRLIQVVNARPQNGHIFLADHVRFFADYLHIMIPERLAAILAGEFGLSGQGLPVSFEEYLLFCQSLRTFYGIEELTLIAEEYCNESDDRFDPEELKETAPPDVELSI